MKRLFILVIALAVMPFASINAQDARNRVTSTIIADALATLPAETPEAYNKTMDELAKTGAEGIETIFISSVAGLNIQRLKDRLWEMLQA